MLKRSEVGKRFCWTIFFVFIYVLGSKISLPFVDLSKALRLNEGTTTGLQLSSAVMGETSAECRFFRLVYPHGCLP